MLIELTSSNFHETTLCLARAIHRLTRRWVNTVQNYVNYHRKNEHGRQLRELFGSDLDDSDYKRKSQTINLVHIFVFSIFPKLLQGVPHTLQ